MLLLTLSSLPLLYNVHIYKKFNPTNETLNLPHSLDIRESKSQEYGLAPVDFELVEQ